MFRRSTRRLTTAFFVVLSLLFSQLAVASYVCPKQADAAAMVAMMQAGVPCEGMDMDQPALCAEHSSSAAQSSEAVKVPTISFPLVVQVIELPMVLDAVEAATVPVSATAEAQPPPDPLFLSTLRLRV